MLKKLRTFRNDMIFISLFSLFSGIMMVVYPDISSKFITYLIAIITMLYGAYNLILYLKHRVAFVYPSQLVKGLLGMCFGVLILIDPGVVMISLPIVLGAIVIMDGVNKLQNAFDIRKMGFDKWWVMLIMAVLVIITGFMMIFYPLASLLSIIVFMGIGLIFNGACDLIHVLIITIKYQNFKRKIEEKINE